MKFRPAGFPQYGFKTMCAAAQNARTRGPRSRPAPAETRPAPRLGIATASNPWSYRAAVALANRLARIAWAVWTKQRNFESQLIPEAT